MRILVVDDDRSLRDALRRALTLGGYEVVLAEGGQDGLTKIATEVAGRRGARHRACPTSTASRCAAGCAPRATACRC